MAETEEDEAGGQHNVTVQSSHLAPRRLVFRQSKDGLCICSCNGRVALSERITLRAEEMRAKSRR